MNIGAAFPSNYLKAEDFPATPANPQGDTTFSMSHVELEKLNTDDGKEEEKPVLYFHGHDKGIILNKTNASAIAQQYGQETTAWNGKPLTLYATEVQFGKQTMMGIRVRLRANPALMAPNQPTAQPGAAAQAAMTKQTLPTPQKDPVLEAAKTKAYKAFIALRKNQNPSMTQQQISDDWLNTVAMYFGSRDAARAADAAGFERLIADNFVGGAPLSIDPSDVPF